MRRSSKKFTTVVAVSLPLVLALSACGADNTDTTDGTTDASNTSGTSAGDSSTPSGTTDDDRYDDDRNDNDQLDDDRDDNDRDDQLDDDRIDGADDDTPLQGEVRDRAEAGAVRLEPGQQRGARRRAQRRGVEVRGPDPA